MAIAITIGLGFGVGALLPASFPRVCDSYFEQHQNAQLPNPPYGMRACDRFGGPEFSDFVLTLFCLGIFCLGLVLAVRLYGRAHVAFSAGIAVASGAIAGILGMLISNLPLRIMLEDVSWYVGLGICAAIGTAIGIAERRRVA